MSMASLVTKVAEELVAPCKPTPCATLPLSSIDHALGLAAMLEMISVYPNNNLQHRRHGVSLPAAKVIREALSKALVPYYPVAGRLVSSGVGARVEVACNGEGVWFVEAAVTNSSLGDMNDWESIPRSVVKEELVPNCPAHLNQEAMIMMVQVTHFQCGGFIVGLKFNHLVFDGLGFGQFLKAIGEIACGRAHPSVDPIWYREAIPVPFMLSKSISLPITKIDLVNSTYDFSIQTIKRLKEQIANETSNQFTTFEVVVAILWKCRTQAINAIGDVYLSFPANVRHLLDQLPKTVGYYGNCIYFLTVTGTSEQIKKASLAELVRFIRNAKESLPTKFKEWASGNLKEDPYKISICYNNMILSDWRFIEVYETDYGWGIPHLVSSIIHDIPLAFGVILKQSLPKDGVHFEGQVVMKEHELRFIDEINKCINS